MGRVSSILAALGICGGWWRQGDRYYQALAETTPRKLALLVGINQYPHTQALNGCLTDVELQRELLIHRFGFQPDDILTLTEQQATRQQIETAFREHIAQQARSGDVVVFHFSGYGRRIQLNEESATVARQDRESYSLPTLNSLVLVDDVEQPGANLGNDLPEETLWLMLRSLPTDRITTILDTSFIPFGTRLQGSLRIRSHPQVKHLDPAALALPQQQSKLNALKNSVPGIVLAAAGSNQMATEAQWGGFDAGLFTYILTQHLWEITSAPTVQVSLNRVAEVVEQLVGKEQQPQLIGVSSSQPGLLAYQTMPEISIGADGVITAVEDDGKTAQLWLAGLPPAVLEYYGTNSCLSVVTETALPDQASAAKLQMRSRKGLTAKAQVISGSSITLQVGQLVQETVRVLPHQIGLTIALDPSLERIERVDATSAFAAIASVSSVLVGEQPADYLFGRVQEQPSATAITANGSTHSSSYGLFSLGQELIPHTDGEAGEAVKVAVRRLIPQLQTLLAAKLWRLTTNEGSSLLKVKATLEIVEPTKRVLMQRSVQRSPLLATNARSGLLDATLLKQAMPSSHSSDPTGIPTLSIGSRIQYRIENHSDRPIYAILLGLDSDKNAIALYPHALTRNSDEGSKPQPKDAVIAPGESITLPEAGGDFEWVIHGPAGFTETQLICSSESFTQTLTALATAMQPQSKQGQIGSLANPLEVAQAILQDLHNASAIATSSSADTKAEPTTTTDTYTLDVKTWASLSFIYQVA